MTILERRIEVPDAMSVSVSDEALAVVLRDGRTISVPLSWYPRLVEGAPEERADWHLIGRGEGIRWPQLDEDISVAGLIAGEPSRERPASLQRWLEQRAARKAGLAPDGG
jgi:hypothetical protein